LIVTALAEPVFNPRERLPAEGAALALVIDNDWATAADWGQRVATAERLITDAGSNDVPVIIAFTAEKPNAEIGPFDAATALDRLRAAKPRPIPTDRPAVYARVAATLETLPGASVAVLADGLAAEGDEAAFNTLLSKNAARVVWAASDRPSLTGLTGADNQVDGFEL
ncbi:MAG: RNA-binding protein, partial [Mesorhizobium sp.]